ncbi:MAG: hypothetical protein N2971_08145 [Chlorobi bacterium]|nr:hypothetical protein [Chlorobiota bacterium]
MEQFRRANRLVAILTAVSVAAGLSSCRSATSVQQERASVPVPLAVATANVGETDSPAPGDYAIEFRTRIGVIRTLFFHLLRENDPDIGARLRELAGVEFVPIAMESRRYLVLSAKSEAKKNREIILAANDAQYGSTEGGVVYLHTDRKAVAIIVDPSSMSPDWLPIARVRGNADILDALEQMRRPDGRIGEEVSGILRLP